MSFGSLPSVLGNGGGVAISVIGGTGLFADGTAAAPSISFAADTDTGFYRPTANQIGLAVAGVSQLFFLSNGRIFGQDQANSLQLASTGFIALTASGTNQNITLTPSGTGEVTIGGTSGVNSGAGYWLTGNANAGGTGITYPAVNTIGFYSGGERARILVSGRFLLGTTTDSGALLQIGTNTTTSAGGIVFGTDTFLYRITTGFLSVGNGTVDGGLLINVGAANNAQFIMQRNSVGFFRVLQDGAGGAIIGTGSSYTAALTLDASQHALFAGNVSLAAGRSILFGGGTISNIYSATDGVIVVANVANTGFGRLCLGPATASFPALARSGTLLQAVVGDGSAYCGFVALTGSFTSVAVRSIAATAGAGEVSYGGTTATTVGAAGGASALPATPTGYIIVNVAGTQMKLPYYNN